MQKMLVMNDEYKEMVENYDVGFMEVLKEHGMTEGSRVIAVVNFDEGIDEGEGKILIGGKNPQEKPLFWFDGVFKNEDDEEVKSLIPMHEVISLRLEGGEKND